MDALTHTLTGITIGMAGYPRWGRRGSLWLAVAANLPDIERAASIGGAAAWVKTAYGGGHSVLTAPLLGLVAAALVHRAVGGWRAALEMVVLGLGSHVALDLVSGPGVRLLWPLSGHFYGLTVMTRYDLLALAALAMALFIPALLNLVNRDIGAAPYRPQTGARLGLAALTLLVALRVALFLIYEDRVAPPSTAGYILIPSAIHPLTWYVVTDMGPAYTVEHFTLGRYDPPLRFRKPQPNRAFETAAETPLAQAFLEMAQFPQYSLERGAQGMLVRIRDLRFYSPMGDGRDFSVEIEVTPQLQVVSQRARM